MGLREILVVICALPFLIGLFSLFAAIPVVFVTAVAIWTARYMGVAI